MNVNCFLRYFFPTGRNISKSHLLSRILGMKASNRRYCTCIEWTMSLVKRYGYKILWIFTARLSAWPLVTSTAICKNRTPHQGKAQWCGKKPQTHSTSTPNEPVLTKTENNCAFHKPSFLYKNNSNSKNHLAIPVFLLPCIFPIWLLPANFNASSWFQVPLKSWS